MSATEVVAGANAPSVHLSGNVAHVGARSFDDTGMR
jgi:hypothetical protein